MRAAEPRDKPTSSIGARHQAHPAGAAARATRRGLAGRAETRYMYEYDLASMNDPDALQYPELPTRTTTKQLIPVY